MKVHRLKAGEGTRRTARGSDMWFKAVAADTSGRFSLMERRLPPGGRMPPPHRHERNLEAYFVLEGVVEFRINDEEFEADPGDFVLVPAGARHTFGNTSNNASTLLVLHAPALDRYFEELEELWERPEAPTVAEETELMSRHGMEP